MGKYGVVPRGGRVNTSLFWVAEGTIAPGSWCVFPHFAMLAMRGGRLFGGDLGLESHGVVCVGKMRRDLVLISFKIVL